ncbi:MAG: VOC family protein [Flavobacterium sp. BFFFF1]|uniref:VOC family protein n=1 Tax=Flavobacterium sp. BFFFF1 TaxID=2015557 RepID=UPI000BC9EC1E|nr:VOC family protein [Flavobacterium sp. BFFFF1]OYU79389.1 MAG: VOC family protein [Flavobacterium sp. BFFFF1]
MAAINPYLTFNGTCEAAFNFYKSVFGGEFPFIGRYKDMPPAEDGKELSPTEGELIMHVSLMIGNTPLMGSDAPGNYEGEMVTGNNVSISINADSRDEANRVFEGLSAGGTVTMPIQDTFWGAYFGMFTDKFGINWMVNFDEVPSNA